MSRFSGAVASLWHDIVVAVVNRQRVPKLLDRFYLSELSDSKSADESHSHEEESKKSKTKQSESWDMGPDLGRVTFTRREMQVLYLICHSATNQKIAMELGLSIRTAEFYVTNLRKKTNTQNKQDLIAWTKKVHVLERIYESRILDGL